MDPLMQARAHLPVPLPHSNPTLSYWQDPPSPLANHTTTPSLPSNVDYVVIGSGISGACLSHNILSRDSSASVLLLEARTTTSGATGRNGGHTKAASYRTYPAHVQQHGREEAVKIAKLEWSNIKDLHATARNLEVECDSHEGPTVDIIYDKPQWQGVQKIALAMNDTIDSGVERYYRIPSDEARQRFLTPNAIGALTYQAGSMSGYKFSTGLITRSLEKGLNLQTNTPVTKLFQNKDDTAWQVQTSRGTVTAQNVILATNGYTPHLIRQLTGTIVPLRGQCEAQRPGTKLPSPLKDTYTFAYESGYEYMITRPVGTANAGDLIMGGGWALLPNGGAGEFGETDDSVIEPRVSAYLNESLVQYFGHANWGDDNSEGRVRREWTGIMGTSADGLPYVGEVPGMKGVWVSASFNGHGMALALKCAEALTGKILHGQWPGWFPQSFVLTQKRMEVPFDGRRDMNPADAQLDEVLEASYSRSRE